MKFTTLKSAEEYVGGISKPSKMPCPSWSTPAQECNTGAKLQKVEGTVCSDCYALKGNYVRYAKNVLPALYRRLETIVKEAWVEAFVFIITKKNLPFWRWHDSGDVQSVEHFTKICAIAFACPDCKFWLPTREYGFVNQYIRQGGIIPDNLVVRFSAYKLGQRINQKLLDGWGVQSSSVGADDSESFNCIAYKQGGKCLDCRACWDKDIANINYPQH